MIDRLVGVGVPRDVVFQKKWEIALGQIDAAMRWGIRKHVVLADAGYGDASEFREALRQRGLRYLVGVQGDHRVWPPGVLPNPPENKAGARGRPRTFWRADADPVKIAEAAKHLGRDAYTVVRWREGSRGKQSSRLIACWVQSAENCQKSRGRTPSEPQWLLCEWLDEEEEPTKFWLASFPRSTSLAALVRLAKLRWRVERDYQELKQEIGLDHYDGRTWRGFHHHATLCAAAHGFLALRRALFPPEQEVDAG